MFPIWYLFAIDVRMRANHDLQDLTFERGCTYTLFHILRYPFFKQSPRRLRIEREKERERDVSLNAFLSLSTIGSNTSWVRALQCWGYLTSHHVFPETHRSHISLLAQSGEHMRLTTNSLSPDLKVSYDPYESQHRAFVQVRCNEWDNCPDPRIQPRPRQPIFF